MNEAFFAALSADSKFAQLFNAAPPGLRRAFKDFIVNRFDGSFASKETARKYLRAMEEQASVALYEAAGIMPVYISKQNVLDYVAKVDGAIKSFALEVFDAEKQPSDAWLTGFRAWAKAWESFRDDVQSTWIMLDTVSRLETAEAYNKDLDKWRESWTKETGYKSKTPSLAQLPNPSIEIPDSVALGFAAGAAGIIALLFAFSGKKA